MKKINLRLLTATVIAGATIASPLSPVAQAQDFSAFSSGSSYAPTFPYPEVSEGEYSANLQTIVDDFNNQLNAYRAANGLSRLRESVALRNEATEWSRNLIQINSHVVNAYTPPKLVHNENRSYSWENLIANHVEDPHAFNNPIIGWQNSPPHNSTLLLPDAKEFGLGIALDKKSGWAYFTLQVR